jgi:hypothetical protein
MTTAQTSTRARDAAAAASKEEEKCGICLSSPLDDESQINGCVHRFCYECIKTWSNTMNECPLCKKRFRQIRRVSAVPKPGKQRQSLRLRRAITFVGDKVHEAMNDSDVEYFNAEENDDNDWDAPNEYRLDGVVVADDEPLEYEEEDEESGGSSEGWEDCTIDITGGDDNGSSSSSGWEVLPKSNSEKRSCRCIEDDEDDVDGDYTDDDDDIVIISKNSEPVTTRSKSTGRQLRKRTRSSAPGNKTPSK